MKLIHTQNTAYVENKCTIKKYTEDFYRVTVFKTKVKKKGYELKKDNKEEFKEYKKDFKEDNKKFSSSLSRSRSKIFEYALCNAFDYFLTLTIDKKKYDRFEYNEFIKNFTQAIRNIRRYYNTDIQYILIPEKHKDGAWHFHGLIKNIPKNLLYINKNGYLDWTTCKKFGYCSLSAVKDNLKVSKYICKYVTKNLGNDIELNKKLYFCSRGLKTAKKILDIELDNNNNLDLLKSTFENDYVKFYDINKKELESLYL